MGFLGLRWRPADRGLSHAARTLSERLGSERGWATLMDWRGLLVLHRGDEAVETLPSGAGFVFGERFGRAEADPSPPCSEHVDCTPIWVEERWGAYIAILIDRAFDVVRVLRDPSGARPCYLSKLAGVEVFFSAAEDFIALAPNVEPDLGFVRAFLRHPAHLGRHTGFVGVVELAPGECAVYARECAHIERYWTPHSFHLRSAPLDFAEGRRALRGAAEACVQACGAKHTKIALRLSGGFDSSVMLALLRRHTEADLVCVNEFWDGAPEGDERAQARTAAEMWDVGLHELHVDPHQVDYARCLSAPLTVKPTMALLGLGNAENDGFFESLGCTIIASGQGGDHLFHRSRTPWIAADALRDGRPSDELFRIALDTARLTRCSVWDVLATMAKGAVGWKMDFGRCSEVMGVLIDVADDEVEEPHAWLADLRRATPARRLRVHQLLHALGYFDESILAPGLNPRALLLSQPIIETCLRIAPYVMTAGGRERALARAAFADLIPDQVAQRVGKGETTRFFAAVLAANRDWMRSILLEGRLVEAGVVDRRALQRALAGPWLQDGVAADGLYALIAAECWLRNLQAARAAAVSATRSILS